MILMSYEIWPHPFQEWFVILGLGLAAINLPTKFEVTVFAHYEKNIYRNTKFGKWSGFRGHSGSLEISPFDRAQYCIEFLLAFYSNCVSILHRFWDMLRPVGRYWLKIADLNLPSSILGPRLRWPSRNFAEMSQQTIVRRWLHDPSFTHLSRTPACDGRTDGWTGKR